MLHFPKLLTQMCDCTLSLYKLKPNFDLRCHTKATKSNTTTTTCYCSEKWCMWCFMKKNLFRLHDEHKMKTQHTFANVFILKSTVGKNVIKFHGEVNVL